MRFYIILWFIIVNVNFNIIGLQATSMTALDNLDVPGVILKNGVVWTQFFFLHICAIFT